ncbi:hypothetical protein MSAN_01402200 [Mycena sanguinolenta]|uniref:Extracellular membrane protein CFEM domain-containing protein n=1 Tax=Mycena sanguinolenta TaxID=230812 RepID=A0A8H6YAH1_9AGAR|nr:hypothetical protein MSAN_01402200 [Mycena sanguinolenta]
MLLWTLAVGTLSVLQPHPAHAAGITAVRSIPGLRSRVGARDLPIIPTACQDDCSPFQPFLTGAQCPAAQCCTAAFDIGYADCFTCVGNATGATDFTIAQEYVDVLITSCMAENFAIPVHPPSPCFPPRAPFPQRRRPKAPLQPRPLRRLPLRRLPLVVRLRLMQASGLALARTSDSDSPLSSRSCYNLLALWIYDFIYRCILYVDDSERTRMLLMKDETQQTLGTWLV